MRMGIFILAALTLLTSCSGTGYTLHENSVLAGGSATSIPVNQVATASATIQASSTPASPLTQVPSPTPSPVLTQLTRGRCCVQPFWSPDSERVLFIDRPALDLPSGIWGITTHGGEPEFITDRLGLYSADLRLRAFLQNGQTRVEDMQSGEQWTIPNDGRAVSFSPDGIWVAWTAGQAGPPFDSAQREVWVSRSDGSDARRLFSAIGGGFVGWMPGGRMLVSGRSALKQSGQQFWIIANLDEQPQEILAILGDGRIRGEQISPNGKWLAYMHTFSSEGGQNGLWIANIETGLRRRLVTFGAYQWRDGENLLVIPLEMNGISHWLTQVEASSGMLTPITDPTVTPFRITNGDWRVSPNGEQVAFLSADDQNIWVLHLPAGE